LQNLRIPAEKPNVKLFLTLLCMASIGVNVWQVNHAAGLEEAMSIQRGGVVKQRKILDQAKSDLVTEKQSSADLFNSAHQILEKTDKLLRENERLLAENAAYRQRFGALDTATEPPTDPSPVAIVATPPDAPKDVSVKPSPVPAKPVTVAAKSVAAAAKPVHTTAKSAAAPAKTNVKKEASILWDDSHP
jgi:hypothetical protein